MQEPIIAGILITNPGKELWPESKSIRAITRLDLACSYEAVAPHMLPYMAGRTLSMVRAPDSIAGECFVQRHALTGRALTSAP